MLAVGHMPLDGCVGAPAVTEADLIRFVNAQAEVYSQVISATGWAV